MTKRIITKNNLDFVERSRQEHSKIEWEKTCLLTSKKTRKFYRVNA